MIVAVSDIHLGKYKESEVLFSKFLDYVADNSRIDDLVLLGDILDMWRGDADTLLRKYKDILKKIVDLQTEKRVFYVVGNHDYHMIHRNTWFQVHPRVVLTSGDKKVYFIHGYQFEYPDDTRIYEEFANLLCFGGDVMGAAVDFFWDLYKETMFALIMPKKWFYENFKKSITPPEERLTRKDMKKIRATITAWRKENEDSIADKFVVFGHTHDPFVDEENGVANTGSWVDDPKYPHFEKYTYLTIEEGKVEKKQFL